MLTCNTIPEKPPQHDHKPHRADLVADQNLRANGPPEESRVRRVARQRVDSLSDELVVPLLHFLRDVVEIAPRGAHGRAARGLAQENERQAEGDGEGVRVLCLVGWEEEVGEQDFDKGEEVGRVVGPAVAEEEEAAGARGGEVVGCCCPEFEEVEEA